MTDRIRAERALAERERLASLGVLAAGVAHEVNTPIAGLSSYAQMLLSETSPGDPRYTILKKMERQTFRAAHLVNNLLEFARPRPRTPLKTDLRAVLANAAESVETTFAGRTLTLEVDADGAPALVIGDPRELEQIFVNLLTNARDASPEGGEVVCRLENGGRVAAGHRRRPGRGRRRRRRREDLPALLHDQEVRRHRPRARHFPRHRPPPRGRDRARAAGRRGHRGPRRPPARARGIAFMRVLVVDDEEVIRDVLGTLLTREGYEVTAAATAGEAVALFEAEPYDVVLLDLMLPDRSGLDVLRDIRRRDPDAVVVIVTAYSSIEGAIEAMREGAFHYIPKPFQNEEVLLTLRKGAEARRLTEENRRLREELSLRYGLGRIVGKSESMRKVFELVRLAGPSRSTILVEGESGTGKELVARAIHTHSPRAGAPFVTVNSGSMPTDLLESNLFGHVKGAFTGAIANKKGLFEVADSGSIFFDEIGTISLETQAKLLRVLQEKEFMRVGSVDTQKVDTRVIAATNVDLKKMVAEGKFRDDLYYRLCVITIQIPPLRERREDIPLLAEHFMRLYASENQKPIVGSRSRGLPRAPRPRLAGQRPRARERHRAGRRALPAGRQDRPGPAARDRPLARPRRAADPPAPRTARPTSRWSRSTSGA